MKEKQTNDLLTSKEAAAFLRISTVTLWRIREKGEIAFHRINGTKIVFKRSDLDAYLQKTFGGAFTVAAN